MSVNLVLFNQYVQNSIQSVKKLLNLCIHRKIHLYLYLDSALSDIIDMLHIHYVSFGSWVSHQLETF